MGEIQKIKGVYVKSGYKTSEFWITILAILTTLSETFKGSMDPKWGAIIAGAISLGYAIVRGFTKAAASIAPPAPETPTNG